MIKHTTSIS